MQYEFIKIQLVIYYIFHSNLRHFFHIFHQQKWKNYEIDRTAILLKSLFEASSHKYPFKMQRLQDVKIA